MINRKYSLLVVFLPLLLSTNLAAQIVLQGTVTNNGGAHLGNGAEPVANALVTLVDQVEATRTFSSLTDAQGQYVMQLIPTAIHATAAQPVEFRLQQNYPNPFNPTTVIAYEVARPGHVTIEIHNAMGQKIKTLLDDFRSDSGQVVWDATDERGQGVAAGVYLYTMKTNKIKLSKKMVLMDGQKGVPSPSYQNLTHRVGTMGKAAVEKYTLRITGDDIAPYEQTDLELTENTTLDIAVTRTVADVDGTVYACVKIGDQWWMAENLRATHYGNGDPIPHITDSPQWAALTTGAYSVYDENEDHVVAYGRLYNAYAVLDSRGLCPQGWHVPTDEEWIQLEMFLGMSASEANKMTAWRGKNEGQLLKSADFGGGDDAGFGARGTGYRDPEGIYRAEHSDNNYWTATTFDNNSSIESILHGLVRRNLTIVRNFHVQTYGFSVRCMRQRQQ